MVQAPFSGFQVALLTVPRTVWNWKRWKSSRSNFAIVLSGVGFSGGICLDHAGSSIDGKQRRNASIVADQGVLEMTLGHLRCRSPPSKWGSIIQNSDVAIRD